MSEGERHPIEQAEQVVRDRLAGGTARVLTMDGMWVDETGRARPAVDHSIDYGPDGSSDVESISEVLRNWPHDEGFCVLLRFLSAV